MKPDYIVATSPGFDEDLDLSQRLDDLLTEEVFAQPRNETLDVAVSSTASLT